MDVFGNILLLAVSFFLLAKGADFFVDGASGIATKLKIPQIIIGLTIVAMGTSAPEAAVSLSAALEQNAAITIGNVVGSNILNILIILGISAAITWLAVGKDTNFVDTPVMLGATVLLLVTGLDGSINYVDGIIFLAVFILYLVYLFVIARKRINKRQLAEGKSLFAADDSVVPLMYRPEGFDENDPDYVAAKKARGLSLPVALILAALGLTMIIFGSNFAVDSATFLARKMGVSDRFIGLTIVALGTSLPELFTSVTAAIKKNADIAVGNIVGSNIFNILFIVGLTSVITEVPFAQNFLIDTAVAFGAGLLLWIPCLVKKGIGRITGVAMLVCYCVYFAYLLLV